MDHRPSDIAEDTECTWDEPKEPSARTRRRRQAVDRASNEDGEEEAVAIKRLKLSELEDRISQ